MAKQTLKFDDVLEPPKTVEVGGTSYRLAPDIPTEIVVLQAKLEIEQLKAQNELDALAQREIDEDNVEQVRGAIDEADEITRRMSQLEDSAKTQILTFFNDPEYRLAEVEQIPVSLSAFFNKLVPYLYGSATLESLLPGQPEGGADPTQANAKKVRAQAGTKSTKSTPKGKPKKSSSSTS